MSNTKRWLVSFGLTFLTGFAIVVVPELDSLNLESLKAGAWVGVLFTAVRGGLKATLEAFLATRVR